MQLAKTVPFAPKQARTDFSVLLDRVRALKPIFRDAARDTETNRRVPKKTMEHLRDAELTKLVRPARRPTLCPSCSNPTWVRLSPALYSLGEDQGLRFASMPVASLCSAAKAPSA